MNWPMPVQDILVNKKRYAYLVSENLRNFLFDARDSIVVLTHMRGLLSLHLHHRLSQGPHLRRSIVGSRFFRYLYDKSFQ